MKEGGRREGEVVREGGRREGEVVVSLSYKTLLPASCPPGGQRSCSFCC